MGSRIGFAPQEFYHVYNRGTERRSIFVENADKDRFLALLYVSNGTSPYKMEGLRQRKRGLTSLEAAYGFDRGAQLVDIAAYCLMPNHFHLLLRERTETGISRFMQKLTTGYTMYFNSRNERTGALFQGTFRAQHADSDRYLRYLISYIHLNPVKLIVPDWKETGLRNSRPVRNFLHLYRYSSFLDYCGEVRIENRIIDPEALPYQLTKQEFEHEIFEWLEIGSGESKFSEVKPRLQDPRNPREV